MGNDDSVPPRRHELVRTGSVRSRARTTWMSSVEAGTLRRGRVHSRADARCGMPRCRLPDGNGIESAGRPVPDTPGSLPHAHVYSDDDALFSSIMAGASGYVLKEVGGATSWGHPAGSVRHVPARSGPDPGASDRLRKDQEAESRLPSSPAGTQGAGAHCAGPVQPPDRGQLFLAEPRSRTTFQPAIEARHAPPHGGRRLRRLWPRAKPSIPGPERPGPRVRSRCD